MIPWLTEPTFPPVTQALEEPNGLLAAGGSLEPHWLLASYRRGIFPWFSDGEPILWWSPDPRMILRPGHIKVSRSLRKTLRQGKFELRVDSDFPAVIHACGQLRAQTHGTWITPHMERAYCRLHEQGFAHSIESWLDGQLVGGLYGVALDRAFFGESMFSMVTDASKVALVHLGELLEPRGFGVIDCQMTTAHLRSMGGEEIPRAQFVEELNRLVSPSPTPQDWRRPDGDS